jgi:hypothetical protein
MKEVLCGGGRGAGGVREYPERILYLPLDVAARQMLWHLTSYCEHSIHGHSIHKTLSLASPTAPRQPRDTLQDYRECVSNDAILSEAGSDEAHSSIGTPLNDASAWRTRNTTRASANPNRASAAISTARERSRRSS